MTAAWSFVALLSGGVAVHAGPLVLSSRDPLRPLVIALVLLAAARVLLGGAEFRRGVRAVTGEGDRLPARIAFASAAAVLIVAVAWNTRAAGGSDSSCYVLQAEAFARGRLALASPLSGVLPDATPAMFAPIGFVPSPVAPFAAVPICAPGLALVMTAASLAAPGAVFLVVPAFAALAVWLTFLLGREIDDGVTGAAAAVLLATSPIFLFQSVQPMSDVPAAALWLAALVSLVGPAGARIGAGTARRQVVAGLCSSAAVLMRPNIALIVLPLVFLLPGRRGPFPDAPEARRRAWLRFGLAAVPGLAAMAWLNAARYGSPFSSGYGSTDVLFSVAHLAPNFARYPRWIVETETPLVAAALLAPWWAWRHADRRRPVLVSLAAVVLTCATYLAYTVFDDWWYIRFLLPALPVLTVLGVAVLLEPVRGHPRVRAAIAMAACALAGAWHLHVVGSRRVLDLQALESRFVVTGGYVSRALPAGAVVLAVQQSGSIRFHGGRETIVWDAIPPGGLDRTIAWLRANNRPPLIALEDGEEPAYRARFATERYGALDWPPAAEVHAPVRVRVYDPASRDDFARGMVRPTESIR